MPFSLFRGFSAGSEAKSNPTSSTVADDVSLPTQKNGFSNGRNMMDHYSSGETAFDSPMDAEQPSYKGRRSYSISTDTFRLPRGFLSGFAPTMTALPEHGDDIRDQTAIPVHASTTAIDTSHSSSVPPSIFSSVFGGGGPNRFRRRAMSVGSASPGTESLLGNTAPVFLDDTKTSELSMLNNKSFTEQLSPTLDDDVVRQTSKFDKNNLANHTPLAMPVDDTINSIPLHRQPVTPLQVSFVQY